MAIVFQGATGFSGTATTTGAMGPYSNGSGLVALVVVSAEVRAQGRTITVSDSVGSTYVLAAQQDNTPATATHYIYYACNVTAGNNTVTFAISGGAAFMRVVAEAYTGIATSAPLDKTNKAEGTGTAISAGSVATTVANELIFVGITNSSAVITLTPGSGYTNRDNVDGVDYVEDKIVSATSTYTGDATSDVSVNWTAIIATFADTPVAPPGNNFTFINPWMIAA